MFSSQQPAASSQQPASQQASKQATQAMSRLLAVLLALLAAASVAHAQVALIIVDTQYCFMPGGDLAVVGGDLVVSPINKLRAMGNFSMIVLTQVRFALS
jgi:nicotinamidase/pyrazinamidase